MNSIATIYSVLWLHKIQETPEEISLRFCKAIDGFHGNDCRVSLSAWSCSLIVVLDILFLYLYSKDAMFASLDCGSIAILDLFVVPPWP